MPTFLNSLLAFFQVFFVLVLTVSAVHGQKPPETLDEYQKSYERRIQKDFLFGVYIPADLGEAFVELNKKIDPESKKKFKNLGEEEAFQKLFFSFGRWITYNWGFYEGSRLSHYLKQIGLHHPDDMARFIIVTYHRHLNKKPLEVKPLIEQIQEDRAQERLERLTEGELLYEEVRPVDTLQQKGKN
jgi:hypothetical protein